MAHVKLILRDYVPKLGEPGDLVSVKPGYARNFLLPKGLAEAATEARVKELEHKRRVIAEEQARALKDLKAVADKLQGMALDFEAQAGEEGKLFGSVTSAQIAERIAAQGLEVDRRKIQTAPIKQVGEHAVSIRLHADLIVPVTVKVTAVGAAPEPVLDEVALDEDGQPIEFGGADDGSER